MADVSTIDTARLYKSYDGGAHVEALRGLDLRVPSGSIFGFLGRNGAGKTTTIKVLLGTARRGYSGCLAAGRTPASRSDVVPASSATTRSCMAR